MKSREIGRSPKRLQKSRVSHWGLSRPSFIDLHDALQILPASDLSYQVDEVLIALVRKLLKVGEVVLEPFYVSTSLEKKGGCQH